MVAHSHAQHETGRGQRGIYDHVFMISTPCLVDLHCTTSIAAGDSCDINLIATPFVLCQFLHGPLLFVVHESQGNLINPPPRGKETNQSFAKSTNLETEFPRLLLFSSLRVPVFVPRN